MGSAFSCTRPERRVVHKVTQPQASTKSKVEAFIRKMSSTQGESKISEILKALPSLDPDRLDNHTTISEAVTPCDISAHTSTSSKDMLQFSPFYSPFYS